MQLEIDQARLLSRVLSRPIFAALARGDDPRKLFRSLYESNLINYSWSVREILLYAYKALCSVYRNEYVYKAAIANRIVFGRHSPRTTAMSIELPVRRSIVDVAVFNGTSTAYEIKTSYDSPRRLVTQTPDYLCAFDKVYVVTHPDSAKSYADVCDERVGVLALDSKDRLKVIRVASGNKNNIDPRSIFRILRRDEYVCALEKLQSAPIDIPNGLIAGHCEEFFSKLDVETAHSVFLAAMRQRTITQKNVRFVSSLPEFLRVLGYSTPLSGQQRQRMLSILDASN
ncbi:sce7726 family protein [Pseudomonas tolaasii]|uniref:sce7726 family protein n=1 Tax=Pseudomonas tolaasii TaxID=29442 RepID=UPI0015A4D673|nr:sce7726 family protein [Pseudomonas tolaasii]NWC28677.1 sce7726 family protein [Pseudomonas tolaasii]